MPSTINALLTDGTAIIVATSRMCMILKFFIFLSVIDFTFTG